MSPETEWIMNDLKVEQLALKMKFLREEYSGINPNASVDEVENYVERKLKKESQLILREQLQIVSSSISQ